MYPSISVVIPCYNYGQYIEDTIASVQAQTFTDYEVIVVDDGSTDEYTQQVLLKISSYNNIRLICKENGGISSARNYGIEQAKGNYIVALDSDDLLHPDFLRECYHMAQDVSNPVIVYTDVEFIGASQGIMRLLPPVPQNMVFRNSLVVTALFPKQYWEIVGGFNCQMVHGYEDWDFWLSMMERGIEFKKVEKPLFFYRIKEDSRNCGVFSSKEKFLKTMRQLVLNHSSLFCLYSHDIVEHIKSEKMPWKYDILQLSELNDLFELTNDECEYIQRWQKYYDYESDNATFSVRAIFHILKNLYEVSTTRKLVLLHKYLTKKILFLHFLRKLVRRLR